MLDLPLEQAWLIKTIPRDWPKQMKSDEVSVPSNHTLYGDLMHQDSKGPISKREMKLAEWESLRIGRNTTTCAGTQAEKEGVRIDSVKCSGLRFRGAGGGCSVSASPALRER